MTVNEALERLEQAKEEIKRSVSCKKYLHKAKHGGYICPICHSGTGQNGTGAVQYRENTNRWICYACNNGKGKHTSGDVVDLYMYENGVDYNTALKELGRIANVDYEQALKDWSKAKQQEEGRFKTMSKTTPPTTARNYAEYFATCRERLPQAEEYLKSRGISMETARAYGLGFDPKADPAGKGYPYPRLIIPSNNRQHYTARSIDDKAKYKKMNPAGVDVEIFNESALNSNSKEIFVTEGVMDALSVIEAGGMAIALNSKENANKLIELLSKNGLDRNKTAFILCLDNDKAGKDGTEVLRAGLTRLNIRFIVADICNGHKDPNEALTADRDSFLSAIEAAKMQAIAKPDNTTLYIDKMMSADLAKFKDNILTGFENLDEQAGGLYPGLYVVAAISSLGKTTLCLQIAEQIAAGGKDVIFFSLEQSRFELVCKGLSRRTQMANPKTAVTSLSIRKGYLPKHVLDAATLYKAEMGDRFSIVEGNFNCDIGYIADYVRQYIAQNNVRPVVFVDYLQILQPTEDNKPSTKETVDKAITELKRLSRELNIPVVVVSSVNRANYLTPIAFESLKETGSIEYTADVIWGLQFQCINKPLFGKKEGLAQKREEINKAKKAKPRKIELVCLKNRYGVANFSCYFDYYPAYDYFEKCTKLDFEKNDYEPMTAGITI